MQERSSVTVSEAERRFDWPLCYEAEAWLQSRLDAFLESNSFARALAERMVSESGTVFFDWVDYLTVPATDEQERIRLGFHPDPLVPERPNLRAHPEALLPR